MKVFRFVLAVFVGVSLLPVHATWTYTAGAGKQNNQPYSGILSDGNWELRVYQPDEASDDFYLGCGGTGGGGRVAGSGTLDLTEVLADTTAAGTPVRIVNIARQAVYRVTSNLTGLVLPSTVTNISDGAFEQCNITSLDLRNTHVRRVGGAAFTWCQSLKEVWLPETLERVGMIAFRTMPNGVVFHFAGDVPYLEPPVDSNPGSGFWAYVSKTEYQNIFAGGNNYQWAFCVNAEKYPNWTRIGKAAYYTEENPFPSGEANWIPQSVRYTSNADYAAPFGNTWFSRTSDTSANGRTYLIQEGSWSGATVARPFLGLPVVDAKRTAITNTIPLYVGSSPSVTVTYTFGAETRTLTATEDTDLVFGFDGLTDSTTYDWSISVTGAAGFDSASGAAATVTPDVVLGEATYTITKDGKTATITVPVTALVPESAQVTFKLDGEAVYSTTVTAAGDCAYTAENLELGRTYDWTIVAAAGDDEDVKTLSFVAERYKWTYVPGEGQRNSQPFTGTITDKTWTLRVYQPDASSDAFWLGCGGSGAGAVVAGAGELDLTQVLDDTTGDGTPVRLVEIGKSALKNTSGLATFVAPATLTNVANVAFENTGVVSADFSQSKLKAIGGCAFAWCKSLVEVRFPKSLERIGSCAFTVIGGNCVFRFAGPPPELVDDAGDKTGTSFSAYITSTPGAYRCLSSGSVNNARMAFAVDFRRFPAWANLGEPWTTTYYDPVAEDAAFPSGESSWIPESVRYTVNENYKAPFGNTNFGRTTDAADSSNRTYLVYEKHGVAGFFFFLR